MNLQNLNVTELSAQEVQETEGGIVPLIFGAAYLVEIVCTAVAVDLLLNSKEYGERLEAAVNNCN